MSAAQPAGHPTAPQRSGHLALDPAALGEREVYHLLTGLVVPRPIAWASTRSASGVANLAPHSYHNVVATDPPVVQLTSSGVKDTLANVRDTGAFVLNVVSEDLLEAMNATAADLHPDEDEAAWAGLALEPAATVDAPRVAAAAAHLECTLREELVIGNGHMILGDVRHIHVATRVWHEGRVDPEALRPVGRLGGSAYAVVERVRRVPRPRAADLGGPGRP